MPSSNPFARFLDVATTPLSDPSPAPAPVQEPDPSPAPAVTPEDTPAADSTPAADHADTAHTPRTSRARLTDEQVGRLRESYLYARELARDAVTPEEWESVSATESRLADQYGVSATTVHELVLGLRRAGAPGPIDTARRARHDRYLAERETLGEAAARARMREVDSVPPSLAVTITVPGGEPVHSIYPPGTYVAVTTVGAGTQDEPADQDSTPDADEPADLDGEA